MKEAKNPPSPYVSTYLTQAPRNFFAALIERKRVSEMWAPSARPERPPPATEPAKPSDDD